MSDEAHDCVCGHLAHDGEDCPEQVRMGGVLFPCGCDDYVLSRYDGTAAPACPACGSNEHDGWTNHDGCPEDWTVYSTFEVRRRWQLLAARDESGGMGEAQ